MASALDRLASFRITYVAIFCFALLYVLSVEIAEAVLDETFRVQVAQAIRVSPTEGPVIPQLQNRVHEVVRTSPWTRIAGVSVDVFVFAADGSPLYFGARSIPPPPGRDLGTTFEDALRLLPATAEVVVSVPHTSVLATSVMVLYGTVLLTVLFFYDRSVARHEEARIAEAIRARDTTAQRASSIESELAAVRERLRKVEPTEQAHAQEVRDLEQQREALQQQLGTLAEREAELRAKAARSLELEQERQALEDLLEEATEDLGQKDTEINELQESLKKAAKSAPSASSKSRAADQLGKRLRTLYKTLDIQDRAIGDLVALRDETMKLRAEEALKRLADDPDNAAIRRKVGGLPPQLSIFELGFAGKGRIYYRRGQQHRFQILAVGAKNSQKTDLEYLSRLPTE